MQIPQREPASAAVFEELTGRKDQVSFGVFWHHHNTVIKAVDNLFSMRTLFFLTLCQSVHMHFLTCSREYDNCSTWRLSPGLLYPCGNGNKYSPVGLFVLLKGPQADEICLVNYVKI